MNKRNKINSNNSIVSELNGYNFGDPLRNLNAGIVLVGFNNLVQVQHKGPSAKYVNHRKKKELKETKEFFWGEDSRLDEICCLMDWDIGAVRQYADDVLQGRKVFDIKNFNFY